METLICRAFSGCLAVVMTMMVVKAGNDGPEVAGAPPWEDGYRVCYRLQVVEPVGADSPQTVMATLPTGGWLRDDAADLLVKSADGTEIPHIVLSHAAAGDTIIQFRRHKEDGVYWVFAVNPAVGDDGISLVEQVDAAREAAEAAGLAMMAAQRGAGDLAGQLRALRGEAEATTATLAAATNELSEWQELMPQRREEKEAAAEALAAAEAAHAAAAEAHSEPGKRASTLSATATGLNREATAAAGEVRRLEGVVAENRRRVEAATAAQAEDERQAERIRQRLERAERAVEGAQSTVERIEAMLADPDLEERRRAVLEGQLEQGKQALAEARQGQAEVEEAVAAAAALEEKRAGEVKVLEDEIRGAESQLPDARSALEVAAAAAEPAAAAAREARQLAAPTAAALDAAEQTLSAARGRNKAADEGIEEATKRMDELAEVIAARTAELAKIEPQLEPLAARTKAAAEAARESAARARELEAIYRELALDSDPRLFREGMTVEYRQWEGDTLGEWAVVFDGLNQSSTITDAAIVDGVFSFEKLFRNSNPRDFSASYRGYLKIGEPGIYSFFVNSDDTAFLFINGYLVDSRVGSNLQVTGRVPVYALGSDMQLEAGVHSVEVHQIVGNNPRANGGLMLLWIPPGGEHWVQIPASAWTQALLAVPTAVTARDGSSVAVIRGGLDHTLRTDGVSLYAVRLEAVGADPEQDNLRWEFADGTIRSGRSVQHLFFAEGDTPVELYSHSDLPPFRRVIHITSDDNPVNPHGLAEVVSTIEAMEMASLDVTELNDLFHFLRRSGQPHRWVATERVARELLRREGLDRAYRVLLECALMQALAHQGREAEAIERIDEALAAAAGIRTLRARVLLAVADMYRDVIRDYQMAGDYYEELLVGHARLRHPIIRQAAVAMGDMYLAVGDRARAGESYRLSRRLGSIGAGPARTDAVQRGALLRLAEQQLREGDATQSMRMLQRIERDFPEEKQDGLYRFLRGEADRVGGDYEEAILNYEAVIASPQWIGFRPAALRGIADSYFRMGNFNKALEWLQVIESSHPEFWDDMELADFAQQVMARQEGGGEETGWFTRRITTFDGVGELPDRVTDGAIISKGFASQPVYPIIKGAHSTLPRVRIENLPSQGYLWVEFWYRTRRGLAHPNERNRSVRTILFGADGRLFYEQGAHLPRTFGEWRKAGFLLPLPPGDSASVELRIRPEADILEIDAIDIRHVSDQLNNQLRRFLDGAVAQ